MNTGRTWTGAGKDGKQEHSGICIGTTPALQTEGVCFPIARNTWVPRSEHR